MPNGGSDCCGTCWFNRRNRGEAGYEHAHDPGSDFCVIRNVEIEHSFYTYCANHPHKSPERDEVPVGPILADRGKGRDVWKPSPDSEEIRKHLLSHLAMIREQPENEYPSLPYRDNVVVWQLGEFHEERAVHDLNRILTFNPEATTGEPLRRTRHSLLAMAKEALSKIGPGGNAPASGTGRPN